MELATKQFVTHITLEDTGDYMVGVSPTKVVLSCNYSMDEEDALGLARGVYQLLEDTFTGMVTGHTDIDVQATDNRLQRQHVTWSDKELRGEKNIQAQSVQSATLKLTAMKVELPSNWDYEPEEGEVILQVPFGYDSNALDRDMYVEAMGDDDLYELGVADWQIVTALREFRKTYKPLPTPFVIDDNETDAAQFGPFLYVSAKLDWSLQPWLNPDS